MIIIFGFRALGIDFSLQVSLEELNLSQITYVQRVIQALIAMNITAIESRDRVSPYFRYRNNRKIQKVFAALRVLSRPSLEK